MEAPGRGGDEGEEEEDQENLFTARTSFFDWDCSILEGGESRRVFLYFHFGLLNLTGQLPTDATLNGQFVFQFRLFLTNGLQESLLVAIGKTGIFFRHLPETFLSFFIKLLIIFQIDTRLTGTVVGDGLLKT